MRRVLLPALPALALLVPSADCWLLQHVVPPGGDRDRRCFAELQQQASLRDTTPTSSQLERLDGLADDGAVDAGLGQTHISQFFLKKCPQAAREENFPEMSPGFREKC